MYLRAKLEQQTKIHAAKSADDNTFPPITTIFGKKKRLICHYFERIYPEKRSLEKVVEKMRINMQIDNVGYASTQRKRNDIMGCERVLEDRTRWRVRRRCCGIEQARKQED